MDTRLLKNIEGLRELTDSLYNVFIYVVSEGK